MREIEGTNSSDIRITIQYAFWSLIYLREITVCFGIEAVSEIFYIGAMGMFALFMFLVAILRKMTIDRVLRFLFVIGLSIAICSISIKNNALSLNEMAKYTVGNVVCLFIFIFIEDIPVSCKLMRFVVILNIVYLISLFLASFLGSMYDDFGYLKYHYSMKNEAGISIYLVACYILMGLLNANRKSRKWLYLLMFTIASWLLWKTGSRTSFIAFSFAVMFLQLYKRSSKIPQILLPTFFGIMVFFPFVWSWVAKVFGNELSSFVIMGKSPFSGREVVWANLLSAVLADPLGNNYGVPIHDFNEYNILSSSYGQHNVFLNLLWNYGIVISVVFLLCMYAAFRRSISKANTRFGITAGVLSLSLLVHMMLETSLISYGFGYLIRAYYMMALVAMKETND